MVQINHWIKVLNQFIELTKYNSIILIFLQCRLITREYREYIIYQSALVHIDLNDFENDQVFLIIDILCI